MNNSDGRLFGLPGAETMYDSPRELWETEIGGQEDFDGELTIEEWSATNSLDEIVSAGLIVEWVVDLLADDDITIDYDRHLRPLLADPELLDIADQLRTTIAGKINYRWADRLVHSAPVVRDDRGVWWAGGLIATNVIATPTTTTGEST